eukprot:NODE_644_length_5057_cov_0.295079.p1 type:complete len:703 gc:universal NODE_644_length_5057_cov_0.295079:3819-1711(-)
MLELTKMDFVDVSELPEGTPFSQVDYYRNVRENALEKVVIRYFVTFPFTGRYFHSMSTNINKMKMVTKDKKLAKFFGEKPVYVESRRQTVFSDVLTSDESDQRVSMQSKESFMKKAEELRSQKIKKLDKLEGFFGGRPPSYIELNKNEPPPRQSIMNMIKNEVKGESRSSELIEEPEELGTKNDLTEDERRILKKRQKKLAEMLGTTPDDGLMKSQKKVTVFEPTLNESNHDLTENEDEISLLKDAFPELLQNYFDENINRRVSSRSIKREEVDADADLDEDDKANKDIRMKRIDKLYNILGERISPNVLEKSRIQSLAVKNGKNVNKKRFDKLQKKFGENVPVEQVNNTVDYAHRAEQHLETMKSLSRMISDQQEVKLESMISEIYEKEPETSESQEDLDEQNRLAKQKKFNKLQKFFGGNIDGAVLMEQTILKDLELTILEEYAGTEEFDILKTELDGLRLKTKSLQKDPRLQKDSAKESAKDAHNSKDSSKNQRTSKDSSKESPKDPRWSNNSSKDSNRDDEPSSPFYVAPEFEARKESFNSAISKRKPARLNSRLDNNAVKSIVVEPLPQLPSDKNSGSYRSLSELNSPRTSFRNAHPFNKFKKNTLLRNAQSMVDVKSVSNEEMSSKTEMSEKKESSLKIENVERSQESTKSPNLESPRNYDITLSRERFEGPQRESTALTIGRQSIGDEILKGYMD